MGIALIKRQKPAGYNNILAEIGERTRKLRVRRSEGM